MTERTGNIPGRRHWPLLVLALTALLAAGGVVYRLSRTEASPLVLLLPLDSRPVNTQHVELLARLAGWGLRLPPPETMDYYTEPGDTTGLFAWLADNLDAADAAIVATNNLLCGGLIASRHPGTYTELETRLEQLEELLAQHGDVDITLLQVLPRQLPTQFDNPAGWARREQLTRYGQLIDQVAQLGGRAAAGQTLVSELETLERTLPADVLQDYLAVYNANRTVGEALLSLVRQGLADRVVLTLDDSARYGLSNLHQRELLQQAGEAGIADRVFALTGADETSMLALARLVVAQQGRTPQFALHFQRAGDATLVLPYEADGLEEAIAEKIRFVGGVIQEAAAGDAAANQLFIHAHAGAEQVPVLAEQITHLERQGRQVGVIDVALVNQADRGFVEALFAEVDAAAITSYAGWNTASNSIGSVVAHLAVRGTVASDLARLTSSFAADDRLAADWEYRFLHVADEVVYQAEVRAQLAAWCVAQGIPTDHIPPERLAEVNAELEWQMQSRLERWATLFPLGDGWTWQVRLPWPRLFEVEIRPSI
ncbi:MAG: DUF4127 family protein [Bacillota bacterium]|jgi:hypothetical protein